MSHFLARIGPVCVALFAGFTQTGDAAGPKSYEAIIRGDWKLLQNDPYSPLELYNLRDDPHERYNLAATHKKVVSELSTALRAHIQRGGATAWQPPLRSGTP